MCVSPFVVHRLCLLFIISICCSVCCLSSPFVFHRLRLLFRLLSTISVCWLPSPFVAHRLCLLFTISICCYSPLKRRCVNVVVCRTDSCFSGTAVQSLQTLMRHHSHYKQPAPRLAGASGRAVSLLTHTADFDSRHLRQQVLSHGLFV